MSLYEASRKLIPHPYALQYPEDMEKLAHDPSTQPVPSTCETNDTCGDGLDTEDVAPDGGYGWVCVAACFTTNCFTWGAVSVSFWEATHAVA
jgi:hypothetical protein